MQIDAASVIARLQKELGSAITRAILAEERADVAEAELAARDSETAEAPEDGT